MKETALSRKTKLTDDPGELRRRAEKRLRALHPEPARPRTDGDSQRQLHELQVHQIELEMQNEELQEARDKMEALLEKYTDLYDFAPVGYLTLNRAGDILEANLTGASLLGIARSALLKRRLGLFVAPEDRPIFNAFLEQVFASEAQEECDLSLQMEGQPPMDVRMRANAVDPEQTCRVAVSDITEHKRAEARRLILNKLESTGILAGGLAHDFNNLLTVILLDLEMAQDLVPVDGQLAELLAGARKAAVTAGSLTQQLITFAKGGAPVRKPTRLAEMIQESIRPAVSGSNVRCEFSLAQDLWAAEVDAGQLGQVFRNVVLNARESMPQGGTVFVRAENVILAAQQQPPLPAGKYVRVSITDQGGGMAKDVLPKIFDPYFSTKAGGQQRGMGLGLTICHAIIEKHDGTIAVETTVGVGTTFHIYLPAIPKLNGAEPGPGPAVALRPGRVLMMDDEEAIRKVIGLTLWGMGQEVDLAENGEQAIEVFKKAQGQGRPFDVVLLDLTVRGGLGGQAALQALRQLDPAVKAIAMSGYAHDPVIMEPERHGFKAALAKPFDIEKLQELIARVRGPKTDEKKPAE